MNAGKNNFILRDGIVMDCLTLFCLLYLGIIDSLIFEYDNSTKIISD